MLSELELVFRPQVQSILDHFSSLHRIRIAFYSPQGKELRVGRGWPACRYCRLLRSRCGYESECRALDVRRRGEAAAGSGLVAYQCHGGMTEAILPVRVNSRLLGFVMVGQFRSRDRLPVAVLRRARAAGVAAALESFFAQAPFYSRGQARHVLGLLEVLVQYIADRHLVASEDALSPILERLRQHPEQRLPLTHAAAMLGRSPSTLSHLFHRKLGKSFRQVRIEALLDAADVRLRPGVSVKEVAASLGIADPLYFSRLYRRHRGFPPSRQLAKAGDVRAAAS